MVTLSCSYIMNSDGTFYREPDARKVEEFLKTDRKHIAKTRIGPWLVSTVFLAIDHAWGPPGTPPVLFETLVFKQASKRPWEDYDGDRYHTYAAALEGHKRLVEKWKGKSEDATPYEA